MTGTGVAVVAIVVGLPLAMVITTLVWSARDLERRRRS